MAAGLSIRAQVSREVVCSHTRADRLQELPFPVSSIPGTATIEEGKAHPSGSGRGQSKIWVTWTLIRRSLLSTTRYQWSS